MGCVLWVASKGDIEDRGRERNDMTDSNSGGGALDGLRVVEMGQLIAGPFCGQLLGDMGAEIVKLEPPETGDQMRHWGQGDRPSWWRVIARNKYSVAVDLRSAGAEKFLAFLTATIYRFQLNGNAMEWGAGRISGMTLKKLAGLDAKTHDLFQVIHGEETLVEDRALVDLTDPGLEHFATRVVNITIRVNTRPRQVHQRELGYWEIVRIAFPDAQPSQTALYTVTYSHGPRENPEGNLQPLHVVVLKNGMVFHVTPTDRS